jgi:hypothetical protein
LNAVPTNHKKKLRMVVELMDEETDNNLMKPSGGISKSTKKKTTATRQARATRSSTRVTHSRAPV